MRKSAESVHLAGSYRVDFRHDFRFVPSYIGAFLSTAAATAVVETASESPGWFYIGFQVARLASVMRVYRADCVIKLHEISAIGQTETVKRRRERRWT
jgi:hypothetical protein